MGRGEAFRGVLRHRSGRGEAWLNQDPGQPQHTANVQMCCVGCPNDCPTFHASVECLTLGVCVGLCLVAGCLSSHVLEIIVRWTVALTLIYLSYFDA